MGVIDVTIDVESENPVERILSAVDVVTRVGRLADERDWEFWRNPQTGGWKRD